MNNKVKGFTYIETLVVIIISGIVLFLTVLIFQNFTSAIHVGKKNHDAWANLTYADFVLSNSFFESAYITSDVNSIYFHSEDSLFRYITFDDENAIVVENNHSDTIPIKINQKILGFQNDTLVKSFYVEINILDEGIPLNYFKNYPARIFLGKKK